MSEAAVVTLPYGRDAADFTPDAHGRPFHVYHALTDETFHVDPDTFLAVAKRNGLDPVTLTKMTTALSPTAEDHAAAEKRQDREDKIAADKRNAALQATLDRLTGERQAAAHAIIDEKAAEERRISDEKATQAALDANVRLEEERVAAQQKVDAERTPSAPVQKKGPDGGKAGDAG